MKYAVILTDGVFEVWSQNVAKERNAKQVVSYFGRRCFGSSVHYDLRGETYQMAEGTWTIDELPESYDKETAIAVAQSKNHCEEVTIRM